MAGIIVGMSEDTESSAEEIKRLGTELDSLEGKIDTIGGISQKSFTELSNRLIDARKELKELLKVAEEGTGFFESLGQRLGGVFFEADTSQLENQVKLREEIERTTRLELDAEIARRQFNSNARTELAEREGLTKDQFEVIMELRQETALLALSEEDRAVALAKIKNDIPLDEVTLYAIAIEREARALFQAEEAQDALNKSQREAEQLTKKLQREALKLAEQQETFSEAALRIDKELAQVKPFLLKIVEDQARAEQILADARNEALEAAREEIAPTFLAFKEDNLTLTEELAKVEADGLTVKKEVLKLTGSESEAIKEQTKFVDTNTKALLANSAARGLVDSVFTTQAAVRDLAQAQKELNEFVVLGEITTEQAAQTMMFLRREMAGASNAAREFEEAQKALTIAIAEGAVSAEEGLEIARRNRIELLESQRTLEAGAERSFLKFIENKISRK